MSYTILSARMGNQDGTAVVLQTGDAGEVHLDLTRLPDDPHVNNREARAAYEAWRAAGNAAAPFAPPPSPTKAVRIAQAWAAADDIQKARVKREARAAGKTVPEYLSDLAGEL